MNTARLVVDFGLVVLIWLVQLIIYPSFAHYSPAELAVWHPRYTSLIALIVGPLMLAQVALVGWEVFTRPSWQALTSAALVGLMWGITAFGAVPLHGQIDAGTDVASAIKSLIHINWWRTAGWTLVFGLGLWAQART